MSHVDVYKDKKYDFFGVHKEEGERGYAYTFRVYNERANKAELTGDFNSWGSTPMKNLGNGIFEVSIDNDSSIEGTCYKYRFYEDDDCRISGDAYAKYAQWGKEKASIIYFDSYEWGDDEWIKESKNENQASSPINIYQVHLGSWRTREGRSYIDGDRYLNYRDIAAQLVGYLLDMGYTHLCIISLTEDTSPFAPTSKHGRPDEFKFFVDTMHKSGIGVILELSNDMEGYWTREFHIDGICLAENKILLGNKEFLIDSSWRKSAFEYAECEMKYQKYKYASLNKALADGDERGRVLSVSHFDVSEGKGSLFEKMQGDYEQKIGNLKLFYSFMMLGAGKKMTFMGSEFGERNEWDESSSLDWFLVECELNARLKKYVKALNHLYLTCKELRSSFRWLSPLTHENDILSFERGKGVIALLNFNNEEKRIDFYEPSDVILSSDDECFGGSGRAGFFEDKVILPPLSALVLLKKTPFFEKAIDYSRDV